MQEIFDVSRINEAAQRVVNVLRKELDYTNIKSAIQTEVRQKSHAYKAGLTNGECVAARVVALALLQQEMITQLAHMKVEDDVDDEAA
jgi:hypothetical protein